MGVKFFSCKKVAINFGDYKKKLRNFAPVERAIIFLMPRLIANFEIDCLVV